MLGALLQESLLGGADVYFIAFNDFLASPANESNPQTNENTRHSFLLSVRLVAISIQLLWDSLMIIPLTVFLSIKKKPEHLRCSGF